MSDRKRKRKGKGKGGKPPLPTARAGISRLSGKDNMQRDTRQPYKGMSFARGGGSGYSNSGMRSAPNLQIPQQVFALEDLKRKIQADEKNFKDRRATEEMAFKERKELASRKADERLRIEYDKVERQRTGLAESQKAFEQKIIEKEHALGEKQVKMDEEHAELLKELRKSNESYGLEAHIRRTVTPVDDMSTGKLIKKTLIRDFDTRVKVPKDQKPVPLRQFMEFVDEPPKREVSSVETETEDSMFQTMEKAYDDVDMNTGPISDERLEEIRRAREKESSEPLRSSEAHSEVAKQHDSSKTESREIAMRDADATADGEGKTTGVVRKMAEDIEKGRLNTMDKQTADEHSKLNKPETGADVPLPTEDQMEIHEPPATGDLPGGSNTVEQLHTNVEGLGGNVPMDIPKQPKGSEYVPTRGEVQPNRRKLVVKRRNMDAEGDFMKREIDGNLRFAAPQGTSKTTKGGGGTKSNRDEKRAPVSRTDIQQRDGFSYFREQIGRDLAQSDEQRRREYAKSRELLDVRGTEFTLKSDTDLKRLPASEYHSMKRGRRDQVRFTGVANGNVAMITD